MVREVKVTLMLAQSAQAAEGLLNTLGAGWTQIAQSVPFAIAGIIELPWEAAGVPHTMRFDLLDDQGKPVTIETPDAGRQPLVIQGQFDVAPQPGLKRGTPLSMPIAINVQPQPLEPGTRYEWRLEVDGKTHEDWRLGFSILPDAQSKAA